MGQEMLRYLYWDLTISGPNRWTIALESASAKKPTPMHISIPSTPATVDSHLSASSDPPPSYTTYPEYGRDRVVSSLVGLFI